MLQLENKGFTALEGIFSIIIFSFIIYYLSNTVLQQGQKIIDATAEIEITSLLNETRQILKNENSCIKTFQLMTNKNGLNSLIRLHSNKKLDEEGEEVFSIFKNSRKLYGPEQNVSIQKYETNQNLKKDGLTNINLEITFEKHLLYSKTRKEVKKLIKVHLLVKNNKIKRCSLSNIIKEHSTWSNYKHGLIYNKGHVSIGTKKSKATLTVQGTLQVGPMKETCNKELEGTIKYDKISQTLKICKGGKNWLPLGVNSIE